MKVHDVDGMRAVMVAGRPCCEASRAAGKSESLDRLLTDYPRGPHDQPQSMCPAFGSLRVGLRMRRTATILSGSACCVYGLTFTSHFYGARRTVGYVPFNSETLVRGQLYEDIRNAVYRDRQAGRLRRRRGDQPVRADRVRACRLTGCRNPSMACASSESMCRALACRPMPRRRMFWPARCFVTLDREAEAGPVARPRAVADMPTVTLIGELFRLDPVGVGALLAPMGLAVGPSVPSREWRDLYGALDCAVAAAVHPFYTASIREMQAAGRPVVGSGPVGSRAPRTGWMPSARRPESAPMRPRRKALPAIQTAAGGEHDRRADNGFGLRGLRTSGRAIAYRGRRGRCRMSARPARGRNGARQIGPGWKRAAPMFSIAPRWSRIWRR